LLGALRDIRFALRALKANPAFVVLAVLCLALGIGASTMMFTVVVDALVDPLGIAEEEGLAIVGEVHRSAPNQVALTSAATLEDWRAALGDRAELGALRGASFIVGASGEEVRIDGAVATGNFFAVLGVQPILGRALQPGDSLAGAEPVVVITERYWRRQLGGDRGVLGRVLRVDGAMHTVVGVVPSLLAVGMPNTIRAAQLWVALPDAAASSPRGERSLLAIAALAEGVGVESLDARLHDIAGELALRHPEGADWTVRVEPLANGNLGFPRSALFAALGAAALLLLVACANLANLTLAHALRRRHEFGIRTAIGASPWRLARQLLAESVLVALVGVALGLVAARLGLDVLARFYSWNTLAPAELPIDAVSLVFAVAVTTGTTLLFGVLPAFEVARGAARAQIAEAGAGTATAHGRGALRRGLIVGQVAGSLVLLVGAALLARSFVNLLALDRGMEVERVTSIRVEAQGGPGSPADVTHYADSVLGALAALPGVESAAATSNLLPMRGGGFRSSAALPGERAGGGAPPEVAYTGITPSFFATLGVPLVSGRPFGANEQPGRVAVVNERMARLLWPNESAVGRQFRLEADPERGWITVVGVSADVLTWDSSGEQPLPMAYLDLAAFPNRPVFFFARTRGTGQALPPEALTRAIDALGFDLRRIVVMPMERVASDPFWREQLFSLWLAVFGGAAVLLTVTGIYGVLSHLVAQRGREIGIRMAVGACRAQVFRVVLRESATFVGVGIAIGLGAAYAVARALRSLLFGVEPFDLPVFVAVPVLLAAVALAASLAPAVRAARIDPTALLRG
jgi:predicted permease